MGSNAIPRAILGLALGEAVFGGGLVVFLDFLQEAGAGEFEGFEVVGVGNAVEYIAAILAGADSSLVAHDAEVL